MIANRPLQCPSPRESVYVCVPRGACVGRRGVDFLGINGTNFSALTKRSRVSMRLMGLRLGGADRLKFPSSVKSTKK